MRQFRKRAFHETAVVQKHALNAEELTDFRTGDRVMTVDGIAGRVVAVNFGPYQNTETYQVTLDNNMGGGDYDGGQLSPLNQTMASIGIEAAEYTASFPVEATTDHTANVDYPELEDILQKRLPNENIKVFAALNKGDSASVPDSSKDDSTESLDADDREDKEDPEDNPDADSMGDNAADPADIADETQAAPGDVTPPSACSFCGHDSFSDPQMTGRGVRMRCDQCGGTMKSWGSQWEPEFPNSSQNHASETWDYRSGGPGGVVQAPGINYKSSAVQALDSLDSMTAVQSLTSQSGIMSWLYGKIYNEVKKRELAEKAGDWWVPPTNDLGTNLQGQAEYQTITPKRVTLGSASELDDPSYRWHFTATWMDVQAKARRIRSEGHVKLVATSKTFVTAEVLGDQATYETQLNYVPGTKKVADWACGCKWAAYTWGRSAKYKRFEGRLCSHALATQYEANARGIFGRDVEPDTVRPDWQKAHHPVVVQHERGKGDLTRRAVPPGNMRRTFSSLILDSDGIYPDPDAVDLVHAPVYASIQNMLENDAPYSDVISMIATSGADFEEGRAMLVEAILSTVSDEGSPVPADGSESGSALSTDASKQHHRHHHDTNPTHNYGYYGLPGGWWWGTCGQCNGAGCGHCSGQGQVPMEPSQTTDTTDAGAGDLTDAAGAVSDGVGASLHTADYSTADPMASMDSNYYYTPAPHSNSRNPASTGWATSQDPGDWGKSLISNDFGVTFDAALHVTGAKEEDAPTVSGVALKAADTGRVLMIQRSNNDEKDPAKGTWEFPGGHHEDGDLTSLHAGIREWEEEIGQKFPGGHVTHVLRSGPYALHTVITPSEKDIDFSKGRSKNNPDDPDNDDHEQAAWWDPDHASKNPALRNELKKSNPFPEIKKAAAASDGYESQAALDFESRLGDEAMFHDEPEGALPSTDGESDVDVDQEVDADPGAGNTRDGEHGDYDFNTTASIIAEFQRTAGGRALAKEAMKDFSFSEQQELINEGKGARARNFNDLQITGTHYELIGDDPADETILWI